MTTVTNDGSDAIARTLEEGQIPLPQNRDIEAFYDIEETLKCMKEAGATKIALQFPDEMLQDATQVADILSKKSGAFVSVLADTSYGSCCVDEVAAQHMDADYIVHYGHSCKSLTRRIPVHFVYGRYPIGIGAFTDSMVKVLRENHKDCHAAVLELDVRYSYCKAAIEAELSTKLHGDCSVTKVYIGLEDISTRDIQPPVFYIGPEGMALNSLMLTHNNLQFYRFDSITSEMAETTNNSNRSLMRRYALMQKARDASVIGILVGTLGVSSYLALVDHLKDLIKKAGRKYYLFVVGKLNIAKLANFPEVDAFVLVACSENSLVDSKEYLRPIVTPYELELALSEEPLWTREYILDFEEVMKLSSKGTKASNSQENQSVSDEPHYSLATGRLVDPRVTRLTDGGSVVGVDDVTQGVLVRTEQSGALIQQTFNSPAAEFLRQRAFQGLGEESEREKSPAVLEQGRSGIAKGYTHEND